MKILEEKGCFLESECYYNGRLLVKRTLNTGFVLSKMKSES